LSLVACGDANQTRNRQTAIEIRQSTVAVPHTAPRRVRVQKGFYPDHRVDFPSALVN